MFELLRAQVLARESNYPELIQLSQQFLSERADPRLLQDLGNILLGSGLNSLAAELYKKSYELDPKSLGALVGFANSVKDILYQEEALRIYRFLHEQLPDNLLIWRNLLLAMEYASFVSDAERFDWAKRWGESQTKIASQDRRRSELPPIPESSLRVGYLSADLCQHTVGLFLRGVLKAHTEKISPYTYHVGQLTDGVTNEIAQFSTHRSCGGIWDEELAEKILADRLHVLIDLSGHTAGSRAHLLARQLAPVQISWLGYFATTGLANLDGVVLDAWHVNEENQNYFTEPIILLESGRLCYQPMEFSPPVSPAPYQKKGVITFGSFNNTAKYNQAVLDLWAGILKRVPGSRLVLKWKTFHDPIFCGRVLELFKNHGISPDRIELRGFSTHDKMLTEYGDIDIALDPFPFSGGLTSCEAMWMGVPIITLPQSRVVSRQTYAFLAAIGDLDELIAKDPDHYLELACQWANDSSRLDDFRSSIREKMSCSRLMDIDNFSRSFEAMLEGQVAQKCGRPVDNSLKTIF